MTNKNAGAVSEAELRTGDLAKILGLQENLTPGLSGDFSLTIQPGSYKINCSGAALASHERNGGTRILRRGYSFTDGIDPESGTLLGGLFFIGGLFA